MDLAAGLVDTEELSELIERASGGSSVRDVLVNLPQVQEIAKAERGVPQLLSWLDAPLGRILPFARTAKFVLGSTITDIDQVGRPKLHMTKTLHN